jgi:hypothetical protein
MDIDVKESTSTLVKLEFPWRCKGKRCVVVENKKASFFGDLGLGLTWEARCRIEVSRHLEVVVVGMEDEVDQVVVVVKWGF